MPKKKSLQPKKLQIHSIPINDLVPADYNPRTHNERQAEQLKESMTRFDFVDPIIANSSTKRKNIIIGGHFRWEMAKELGFTEVPVVYVYIDDIEKEKELNLRLNRNTGEWDIEKLKSFETDFLLNIGFDDADLSDIWNDALESEDDGFNEEEELAKIVTPTSKPGDLYQLGLHRLLCGDATNLDDVLRLVGEERMDMGYFDPPYNLGLSYDKGISNKKNYGGKKTNDNKTDEEYEEFLRTFLSNAVSVCKSDAHMFCYCDQAYVGLLQRLYPELGIDYLRTCLWVKNNANITPQIAFSKVYEPCVYGVRGKPYLSDRTQNLTEILNKEVGSGNRTIDDILDILDIWLCKRLPTTEYEHPTSKNPTLHERPLRRCTRVGDRVLDLTAGSGSTLIACEQMKRKAFLMEIEPVFCDLIIRRWETLTGLKASLIES